MGDDPIMEHFGEYLKRERVGRKIPLGEIAEETRIPAHILEAIEEARLESLPAEVYVKGFIRAYARYLGMDDKEVLQRFQHDLGHFLPTATHTLNKKLGHRKKPWIAWAIMAIAIATTLFFVLSIQKENPIPIETQSSREKQASSSPNAGTVKENRTPDPSKEGSPASLRVEPSTKGLEGAVMTERPQEQPEGLPPEKVLPSSTPLVRTSPPEPFSLEARARSLTWIRYAVDGGPPEEVLLRPDETFVWNATQRLKLRLGNGGGVSLTLNGKPMDPVGKEGEVVVLELPKDPDPKKSAAAR